MNKEECEHIWYGVGEPYIYVDHLYIDVKCRKCGKEDKEVYNKLGLVSEL